MRARLLVLTLVGTSLLARPARADFDIAIGLRWNPLNYTTPVSTTGANNATPLTGWNTTNLNNYFGMFFLDGRLGFQVGLDLGYSSRHDETSGIGAGDLSYTQFGFSVGGKWYITRPRGQHVSPYLYLDFYKYFASVSTSATIPKGYDGFLASLASPLGIDLAGGAEYFFTPAFSLGAEILGLKYAFTTGSYPTNPNGIGGGEISETNHYVTFYTGLSLNYRFGITVKERVRETEEEPEPAPRPRRKRAPQPEPPPPPPPGEEPPPAPESVD
jgi:hypothetical protein